MLLIIGLGNPGEEYKKTRHNAGFIIIDELRKKWNLPEFKFNKKFNAEVSKKSCGLWVMGCGLLLVKPQSFMNRSGEAVRKIMDYYKLTPKNIIVIHDDLDIEIGKYKISANSSSAGHKGVQSIIDNLGTQKFKRIRIGVEKAGGRKNRGKISGNDFVLQDFEEEEIEKVRKMVGDIKKEIK
ncbi:aminoacyl-tRNA hydrolase [bacterium]|nr:aminoacyl-tRNA hydrolase [bacterium]